METVELRDYARPLIKWWWLLIASALVSAVASFIYTADQPQRYRSVSTIMVGSVLSEPNPNSGELNLTNQLASSYALIAERGPVQEATKEALGLTWLPEYYARVVPNSQLIELSVIDSDPVRAQIVAQELVHQLILRTPSAEQAEDRKPFVDDQLSKLESSITETEAEIERLGQELGDMFSARQIADTNAQIAALESKKAALQANYSAFLAGSQQGATNTITVIEPANLPTVPLDSGRFNTILLAAALGFSVAAAGAYLIEYLDDVLRTEDDVRRILDLPTLSLVPRTSGSQQRDQLLSVASGKPSPVSDAYSSLSLRIQRRMRNSDLKSVLVTSDTPESGKSTTAANLGVALAQSGKRVLIVDADLYRPAQQLFFSLPNHTGLTTALTRKQYSLDRLVQATSHRGLFVMTAGPVEPNPTELLVSNRLHVLFEELREQVDVVVVDSPPVNASVDASVLGAATDSVLLVFRAGRTKTGPAKRSVSTLQHVGAYILGVVLTGVPVRKSAYYLGRNYEPSAFSATPVGTTHSSNGSAAGRRVIHLSDDGK